VEAMTRTKVPMSEQEWVEIGNTSKRVYNTLISLLCDPRLHERMTKKQMRGLKKAISGVVSFKSEAEEAMYREIGYLHKGDRKLLNVFYGEEVRIDVITSEDAPTLINKLRRDDQ
jgi:hypothetical protein